MWRLSPPPQKGGRDLELFMLSDRHATRPRYTTHQQEDGGSEEYGSENRTERNGGRLPGLPVVRGPWQERDLPNVGHCAEQVILSPHLAKAVEVVVRILCRSLRPEALLPKRVNSLDKVLIDTRVVLCGGVSIVVGC